MVKTKQFLSLAIIGLAASSLATQTYRASELLYRSLERSQFVPMTGIFSQKSFGGNRCEVQVRIDQAADGKVKVAMLQPLSLQGHASVDDGRTWTSYFPDEKRMVIQESPRANQVDPRKRIALAEKNYTMKVEQGENIAGRKSLLITASPRAEELPVRKYCLDQEKLFMLRLECIDANGKVSRQFDTKSVSFPDNVRSDSLTLNPIGDYREIVIKDSTRWRSTRYVESRMGFAPVIPKEIPFGFAISDRRLTDSDDGSYVTIRLSDGLVTASVYQWKGSGSEPWPDRRRDKEVDGVKMRIVGDLPDSVLNRILESFLKRTMANIIQALETLRGSPAFQSPENQSGRPTIITIVFQP